MHKKGVIFSISTILLLLSLLITARIYHGYSSDVGEDMVDMSISEKMAYLIDDISGGIYGDLLPIEIESITRSGGKITLLMNDIIRLQDNRDYDDRMSSYANFIESTYATVNQINISLTNFTANFTIDPYYSEFDLNEDDLYIYNDQNNITDITLRFKVNEQNPGLDTSSITAGSTSLRIILLNDDEDVKEDSTYLIDPTAENTFSYDAQGTALYNVTFGSFSGYPSATLYISAQSYTEIHEIHLSFTEHSDNLIVRGGALTIDMLNFNLTQEIILLEE